MWGGGLLIAVAAVACGGGLEGVYQPEPGKSGLAGGGLVEQIEFRSGDKVEITLMGITKEGTYEVDGDRVRIAVSGDIQIFRVDDDGCIDGGAIGRYCPKGGIASGDHDKRKENGKRPSGTYVARDGNGLVTLVFRSGNEAELTMTERGKTSPAIVASYSIRGDRVEFRLLEFDESFELTYREDVLEGVIQGENVRFTRR